MHTHLEQWAADTAAPGEQLEVRCLTQGSHLSRGQFFWDSNPQPRVTSPTLCPLGHNFALGSPLSHGQFFWDSELRFEPTTSGYKSRTLSTRPWLPRETRNLKQAVSTNVSKNIRQTSNYNEKLEFEIEMKNVSITFLNVYNFSANILIMWLTLSLPLTKFYIVYETMFPLHWWNFPASCVFTVTR